MVEGSFLHQGFARFLASVSLFQVSFSVFPDLVHMSYYPQQFTPDDFLRVLREARECVESRVAFFRDLLGLARDWIRRAEI